MTYRMVDLIQKRDGGHFEKVEIDWLISGYATGEVPITKWQH